MLRHVQSGVPSVFTGPTGGRQPGSHQSRGSGNGHQGRVPSPKVSGRQPRRLATVHPPPPSPNRHQPRPLPPGEATAGAPVVSPPKGLLGPSGRRPHPPPPGEASAATRNERLRKLPEETSHPECHESRSQSSPRTKPSNGKTAERPPGLATPASTQPATRWGGASPNRPARPPDGTTKSSKPSYTTSKHEPGRQTGRATSTARQGVNTSLSPAGATPRPNAPGGRARAEEEGHLHAVSRRRRHAPTRSSGGGQVAPAARRSGGVQFSIHQLQ